MNIIYMEMKCVYNVLMLPGVMKRERPKWNKVKDFYINEYIFKKII